MRAVRSRYPVFLSTAVAALSIVSLSSAKGSGAADISGIRIKNFGVVSENLYRGAQPRPEDYKDLASLGIKTVVDLQNEGERAEESQVEATGMKFFRVGMSDRSWPDSSKVDALFKILDDPQNQPIFMHCRGGHHRTGIMSALYRIRHDNWDIQRACDEMDKYGFHAGMGHGGLKGFVRDYYTQYTRSSQVTPNQVVTDAAARQP